MKLHLIENIWFSFDQNDLTFQVFFFYVAAGSEEREVSTDPHLCQGTNMAPWNLLLNGYKTLIEVKTLVLLCRLPQVL